MVKKLKKNKFRRPDSRPILVGSYIFTLLESMGGSRERSRLDSLWKNWEQVAGEEIASLTTPLGHHGATLLLGAEDAMAIQEGRMMSEEILARVNGFLKTQYFTQLKISLKEE